MAQRKQGEEPEATEVETETTPSGIEVTLDPMVAKKTIGVAHVKRAYPDYEGEALVWTRETPTLVFDQDTPAEVLAMLKDENSLTVK